METLGTTFDDLRSKIAFRHGWTRDSARWSDEKKAALNEFIKGGIQRFLFNSMVPGTLKVYEWSFLKDRYEFDTVSAKETYSLPANFGSADGPRMFWADTDISLRPILLVNESRIYTLQSQTPSSSGTPCYASIRAKKQLGASEQGYELSIFPTPNAAYSMRLSYNVLPYMLGESLLHPHGGVPHARTLELACLAESEQRTDNRKGLEEDYDKALAASISYDSRNKSSDLGMNRDTSDQEAHEYTSSYYVYLNGELGE